jgi:MtN3 and saliva related transmembrane protein
MDWEIFGLIAGLITVSAFVPQIIKGYKSKHLGDLSYLLTFFFVVGMSMWIAYGVEKKSFAIILTNSIAVLFNLIIIGMKYTFERKKD